MGTRNTRLWQTGEDKRTQRAFIGRRSVKTQTLIEGMVTVPKELGTHLYKETECFSGHLWVSPLVKKYSPCTRG